MLSFLKYNIWPFKITAQSPKPHPVILFFTFEPEKKNLKTIKQLFGVCALATLFFYLSPCLRDIGQQFQSSLSSEDKTTY